MTAESSVVDSVGLPWLQIVFGLLGGSALLLYGLDVMSAALQAVAGNRMRVMLDRLTRNRVMGLATGAVTTAVLQSSSVTTVLLVGFVSAGLMTLQQSVGVILGANIGSTVTAQIIAFRVTDWALALVAAGYVTQMLGKGEMVKLYGRLVLGFGLMFLALKLMADGLEPLRVYPPFHEVMASLANPLLGVLVGALFTALVQSSAVTTGIAIVLAGQGLLTLPAGIALALGANVGTCVTAAIAAIGKPRVAVRAALVHVLFNVIGVALWIGFVEELAWLSRWVSPAQPELEAASRRAAEVPRQIANAHTIFNVLNALLFLPAVGLLARLVTALVPERPSGPATLQPQYLDPVLLETPALALQRVRLETERMGGLVAGMVQDALPVVLAGDAAALAALQARDTDVDTLHGFIIDYMRELNARSLTAQDAGAAHDLMAAADHLESIADIVEADLALATQRRLETGLVISAETEARFRVLHDRVLAYLRRAVAAITHDSEPDARAVSDAKASLNAEADALIAHIRQRLQAAAPNRLQAYKIETDIVECLKRIYYFSKRISRTVAPKTDPAADPAADPDDDDEPPSAVSPAHLGDA